MDNHIITIRGQWEPWKMTIDLKELADSAGVKKKIRKPDGTSYDTEIISVPLPRARKILKLIRDNGTEEDFRKCDEYLEPNTKLHKYWEELCRI